MNEYNTTSELQKVIIAGVVSDELSDDEIPTRMRYVIANVRSEWFDGIYGPIWETICRYYFSTGTTPTAGDFEELLATRPDLPLSRKAEYAEAYQERAEESVSFARLKFNVVTLGERWRHGSLTTALQTSLQINLGSVAGGPTGALAGYHDAVSYLSEELGRIQQTEAEALAEGDIRGEAAELLREYRDAKAGKQVGILTGFPTLDQYTNGMHPGELILIAGFAGEGKSQTTYNIAYNAAIIEGRNVLFGCVEVSRKEVRRHFAVRHSHHPKFGAPKGLNYTDIKNGTLEPDDEQLYADVVQDLSTAGYGRLYVFTIHHADSVDSIARKLEEKSKEFHVDLVVVDYLGLLGSVTSRNSEREKLNDVLRAAKRLATDANGGDGVSILSPWQITRHAWEEGKLTQSYTKTAMAETSEGERSPDIIVSLIREQPDNRTKLKAQILKNRDGVEGEQFDLYTDFETCHVTEDDLLAGYLG